MHLRISFEYFLTVSEIFTFYSFLGQAIFQAKEQA